MTSKIIAVLAICPFFICGVCAVRTGTTQCDTVKTDTMIGRDCDDGTGFSSLKGSADNLFVGLDRRGRRVFFIEPNKHTCYIDDYIYEGDTMGQVSSNSTCPTGQADFRTSCYVRRVTARVYPKLQHYAVVCNN